MQSSNPAWVVIMVMAGLIVPTIAWSEGTGAARCTPYPSCLLGDFQPGPGGPGVTQRMTVPDRPATGPGLQGVAPGPALTPDRRPDRSWNPSLAPRL